MKYKGQFLDSKNTLYSLYLDSGGAETSVELAAAPVIIEYEPDADIFKPLKLSGATITVQSQSPLYDLYAATAHSVRAWVEVASSGQIVWQGYVTPCVYSQGYGEYLSDIEIECVDCLSTISEYKYNPATKSVRTFRDLIKECISVSGMQVSGIVADTSAFNLDTSVSDLNWFDEDGEPSTYKELLEEILKFAHLTMFQYGSTVYILNYDRLVTGTALYSFDSNFANPAPYSISALTIDKIYSGAKISLSEIYNNYTVVGSPYNVDEIIEDPLEGQYLGKRLLDGERTYTANYTGFSSGTKTQEWTHRVVHFDNLNSNVTLHQYNFDGSNYTGTHSPSYQQNYFCAWLLKCWGYDSGAIKDVGYPTKTDFKYYVGARVANLANSKFRGNNLKLITINSQLGTAGIYPQGGYLCLSLDCMFSRSNDTPQKWMYQPGYASIAKTEVKITTLPYFLAAIKIGNKYYNGTAWTTTASTARVEIGKNGDPKNFYWHSVKNTNVYSNNVDGLSGYIIKLPTEALSGELSVAIYTPQNDHWNVDHVYLRNIKLEIAYAQQETELSTEAAFDYDNKYNDSVGDGAKTGEDITLKITTWDGSSYSKAAPLLGGNVLEAIGSQRQEYNIIDSYLKQGKQANKQIEVEVDGLIMPFRYVADGTEKLIINGCTYDLQANTTTLNLVQKR